MTAQIIKYSARIRFKSAIFASVYVLKTIKMNIEEFREYCLSLKGVREKMPFPNVPINTVVMFYAFM